MSKVALVSGGTSGIGLAIAQPVGRGNRAPGAGETVDYTPARPGAGHALDSVGDFAQVHGRLAPAPGEAGRAARAPIRRRSGPSGSAAARSGPAAPVAAWSTSRLCEPDYTLISLVRHSQMDTKCP